MYNHISNIANIKHVNREIFGIAMTLFHYYTYFKSFKEFDRTEISVGCIYLASKIEWYFIPVQEALNIFNKLSANKPPNPPDFNKFEIEIMSFLGFDLDIETPYRFVYSYLERHAPQLIKNQTLINLTFNLINDSYRKPLCLYWPANVIALACLHIAGGILELDISSLVKDTIISNKDLEDCIKHLLSLFESNINLS